MSTGTILAIAIPSLLVLVILLTYANIRRQGSSRATGVLARETIARDKSVVAVSAAPAQTGRELERAAVVGRSSVALDVRPIADLAPWVPPDREEIGMARRQFLNRGMVTMMTLGLSGFGVSLIAFLWPKLSGGFGADIRLGSIQDVDTKLAASKNFAYFPEGRLYITAYPKDALSKAAKVYSGGVLEGMKAGYVALYQKCPHLGCRVPQCDTSQWFECPCHGSQYSRVGEKKGGPAPRGMDRFAMKVTADGSVVVSTGALSQGPAIGTNTTGQETEGPHCVSGGEHKH